MGDNVGNWENNIGYLPFCMRQVSHQLEIKHYWSQSSLIHICDCLPGVAVQPLAKASIFHYIYIDHWDMKGCNCHFVKWQIHLFISKGTTCSCKNRRVTCYNMTIFRLKSLGHSLQPIEIFMRRRVEITITFQLQILLVCFYVICDRWDTGRGPSQWSGSPVRSCLRFA